MQALRASRAKSAVVPDALQIARQLSGMTLEGGPYTVTMRAQDHQLQTPLYVSAMQVAQGKFLKFDLEGSGLGFQTERFLDSRAVSMPHTCAMRRPE
jgi:branched-chain amino acid transport system substrate-binding protein